MMPSSETFEIIDIKATIITDGSFVVVTHHSEIQFDILFPILGLAASRRGLPSQNMTT